MFVCDCRRRNRGEEGHLQQKQGQGLFAAYGYVLFAYIFPSHFQNASNVKMPLVVIISIVIDIRTEPPKSQSFDLYLLSIDFLCHS